MAMDTVRMGQLHVEALAELIGGRVTPGSGNQWKDPIDARASRLDTEFAFGAEGKSTLGASIGFSRALIEKAREQAGGERPLLGFRFYGNERLDKIDEDWVAVTIADFGELLEAARERESLRAQLAQAEDHARELQDNGDSEDEDNPSPEVVRLRAEIINLQGLLQEAADELNEAQGELGRHLAAKPPADQAELQRLREDSEFKSRIIAGLRDQLQAGTRGTLQAAMASPPPVLPWLCVFQMRGADGRPQHTGIFYDPAGSMESVSISSVRIERTADDKPRLVVNETLVRQGELYVDGQLAARVGAP